MSVYTQVFGGTTIYPSDVSYLAIALSGDTTLEWPLESSTANDVAAPILDVNPTSNGFSITLPPANNTGTGQTVLFNNVSGSYSFTVKDAAGGTIATVAFGEQWQIYLSDNSTAAGTWRVFRYGASTATVQPSALAGAGLTTSGSTLAQNEPVTTFNSGSLSGGVFTISAANRAGVFVWTDTGTATVALPSVVTAGNGWLVSIRNEGGGSITIDPAGIETINGLSSITLNPDDSAILHTDGVTWYTVGLGQQAIFAFDYTVVTVTGGTYILSGAELNRIAYKFVGTLTSDATIVIPATVQQYWIDNSTAGPWSLFVTTSGGTPILVPQGSRSIFYCNGADIVNADTSSFSFPVAVNQGGTGATTASAARLNLGITTFADAIVTATTGSSVRSTIGAAAAGANSDITSLTGLTTPLTVAQGGTGTSTAFTTGSVVFAGASGVYSQDNSNLFWDNTNDRLGIGTPSPSAPLTVGDATAPTNVTVLNSLISTNTSAGANVVLRKSVDTANGANVTLIKSRGTAASPTAVNSADTVGAITFSGYGGTNYRPTAQISAIVDTYTSDTNVSGYLTFSTNGGSTSVTERMRLDALGRLLVGTTATNDIAGNTGVVQVETANAASNISIVRNTANPTPGYLVFGKSRGAALGGRTVVQADDGLGSLFFAGADGTNMVLGATIAAAVDGTPGTNDMPGRLMFSTTADGASSPTERMRISNAGGVSVGTTTDPGAGKILAAKGILPRVNAQTTTASPWAWNSDDYDQQSFSALANALTINADAGTPTDGEKQILRFKDNATPRVLTFTGGASKAFRDMTGALTVSGSNFTYTTVASKTVYFGCVYNGADARWDIIAVTAQP